MLNDLTILSHLVAPFGAAVSLVALTSYLRSRGFPNRPKLPYPPGPKGLPFIGNIFDLPRDMHIWEGFTQMAEAYRTSMVFAFGRTHNLIPCAETEVVYLSMFGTNIVVLNSSEAIADLLDKRSAIYSDKVAACVGFLRSTSNAPSQQPRSPMLELMGLSKWAIVAFEYGERWRIHRRLFNQFFNLATVDRYDQDQKKMASRLLKNLNDNPADFRHHIQLATGSLALSITYGIKVDSPTNPYFSTAEDVLEKLLEAQVPGAFPVEFLPFRECSWLRKLPKHDSSPVVRHFPSWFPGGGARSYGGGVYKRSMDCITSPMQYAVERFEVCSIYEFPSLKLELDRVVARPIAPWLWSAWRIWRKVEDRA